MKPYQCYQRRIGVDHAKIFVRFSAITLFCLGFSMPAPAIGLRIQLSTFGNPEIARRLNRDINTVNQGVISKMSFSPNVSKITFPKNCHIYGQYLIRDLDSLGGSESFANSINNQGKVVGLSRTAGDNAIHPFIYSKGKMADLFPKIETVENINNLGQVVGGLTSGDLFVPVVYDTAKVRTQVLGTLGGVTSFGFNGTSLANNDRGQTVGYSYVDDTNRHAFLYTNGFMYDIGSFGGYSVANGINKKSHIVGFSSNSLSGRAHAFLFANGKMKDMNPSNDPNFENSESFARDINNRDEIVGEFLTPDQSAFQSFIYKKGKFTSFHLAGSPMTIPFSINKSGKIVGIMDVPYQSTCPGPSNTQISCTMFRQHAFLYRKGHLIDLNKLITKNTDWELSWAFAINDAGEIVGYGARNGQFRSFLLTPISDKHEKLDDKS
jgi:probable HAF family extracellular repeat protein